MDNVTFFPVQKSDELDRSMRERNTQKVYDYEESYNDIFKDSLRKGVYNRDYVIALCSKLLEVVHSHKINDNQLAITLKYSLKKLLDSINQETVATSGDLMLTCNKCNFVDIVLKRDARGWLCPNCHMQRIKCIPKK